MKKVKKFFIIIGMMLILSACGKETDSSITDNKDDIEQNEEEQKEEQVAIKSSPDKYTWYIKNYVGKNIASVGYTSLGGSRIDSYGAGYLKLIFVNSNGSYIDINNEEEMKKYVVTAQNVKPNSEMKYIFQKDENGEEYDNLIENQTYEEIVLAVKEVGSSEEGITALKEINTSSDKYTRYIRDYVGRNLLSCGYLSLGGDYRDTYGAGSIKFVLILENGSYIDITDEEEMKRYIVTGQSIPPNTELKMQFLKDENGEEYDNLIDYQSIEEIELYVSLIE